MGNRKGSTLALTLVIFLVLMIFATFIFSFVVSENKQAIWHENDTRAYYLARSGALAVESGIIGMSKDDDGVKFEKILNDWSLEPNSEPIKIVFNEEDSNNNELIKNNEKIEVRLIKNDESIEIESTGRVNQVENKVVRILNFTKVEGPGEDSTLDYAIYSKGKIIGMIESGSKQNVFGNYVENGLIVYPPVEFPTFDFSEKPTGGYDEKVLIENGILEIDASISERNIRFTNSELKEKNIYTIKITGNKKVNIYFEKELKMEKNSTLTWVSESQEVNVYFEDDFEMVENSKFIWDSTSSDLNLIVKDEFEIKKKAEIKKLNEDSDSKINIYIDDDEIKLGEMAIINGNIYSNAKEIEIEGKGTINGLIYAPNSEIEIEDDIKINGGIVGKKVEIDGDKVVITHDPKYAKLPSSSSSTEPSSGNGYKFGSYFK